MKRASKKWLIWALSLWLVVSILPTTASARTAVDVSAPTSLTVAAPAAGIRFALYRVADADKVGHFTLAGDFAAYDTVLAAPGKEGWQTLAGTVAALAARDGLQPDAVGTAGEDGQITFDNLSVGLYLVTADKLTTPDHYVYALQPSLVSLPSLETGDWWNYEPTVEPKHEKTYNPPRTSCRVHKAWSDAKAPGHRPESIVALLLRNGEVYDRITLSEDNRWNHQWDNLDASYTWQVVEEQIHEDYTLHIDGTETAYVLTNTIKPSVIPGDTTHDQERPDDTLPQTGMLWWPVPVLTAVGLLCVFVGLLLKRKGKPHED